MWRQVLCHPSLIPAATGGVAVISLCYNVEHRSETSSVSQEGLRILCVYIMYTINVRIISAKLEPTLTTSIPNSSAEVSNVRAGSQCGDRETKAVWDPRPPARYWCEDEDPIQPVFPLEGGTASFFLFFFFFTADETVQLRDLLTDDSVQMVHTY